MTASTGFIPKNGTLNSWDDIKPYFDTLIETKPNTTQELELLLIQYSETVAWFAEENAWAYIKMTCDTENKEKVARYELFATEIAPQLEVATNTFEKQLSTFSTFEQLDAERYGQLKKNIQRSLEMFRDENVLLDAKLSKLGSDFSQVSGGITVTLDGEEMPIPRAATRLELKDREKRKEAWMAISEAYQSVSDKLDAIFAEMLSLRIEVAKNAGYKNFRDYQHDNYHRFDYTPADAEEFSKSIEKYVVPLSRDINERHRKKLGLAQDDYRPWDGNAFGPDEEPLKPFKTGDELLDKTIDIFSELHPQFGDNLKAMKKANLFDLESRKGKSPGGYNYGLEQTGMPFIFMNAAGTQSNLTTLMHEGGHAMHTFLTADEPLIQYRDTPMEMAETASMSMELMTSGLWNKFYNEADHRLARRKHLEGIIGLLPWVATVDSFQHWIYLNPDHTPDERDAAFKAINERFGAINMNKEGLDKLLQKRWQRQIHIFEVPFYYIEYGIAQLGALQVYRNFKSNPKLGLDGYIKGLSLGSTKPMPEVWDVMNIKFDFSSDTIRELMEFVQSELEALQD